MEWQKPRPWSGKDLKGVWVPTLKIDGVQARYTGIRWEARSGKPLYNLDHLAAERRVGTIYEVYDGKSWDTTVGLVRRSKNGEPVPELFLYPLAPEVDYRLIYRGGETWVDPIAARILVTLEDVTAEGFEGLVLVNKDTGERLKVKPKETHDVPVEKVLVGTGKHDGRMGALMTPRGKVGTGFTDEQRELWWGRRQAIKSGAVYTIEVEAMGLTKAGKFRHPRFLRERFDK